MTTNQNRDDENVLDFPFARQFLPAYDRIIADGTPQKTQLKWISLISELDTALKAQKERRYADAQRSYKRMLGHSHDLFQKGQHQDALRTKGLYKNHVDLFITLTSGAMKQGTPAGKLLSAIRDDYKMWNSPLDALNQAIEAKKEGRDQAALDAYTKAIKRMKLFSKSTEGESSKTKILRQKYIKDFIAQTSDAIKKGTPEGKILAALRDDLLFKNGKKQQEQTIKVEPLTKEPFSIKGPMGVTPIEIATPKEQIKHSYAFTSGEIAQAGARLIKLAKTHTGLDVTDLLSEIRKMDMSLKKGNKPLEPNRLWDSFYNFDKKIAEKHARISAAPVKKGLLEAWQNVNSALQDTLRHGNDLASNSIRQELKRHKQKPGGFAPFYQPTIRSILADHFRKAINKVTKPVSSRIAPLFKAAHNDDTADVIELSTYQAPVATNRVVPGKKQTAPQLARNM